MTGRLEEISLVFKWIRAERALAALCLLTACSAPPSAPAPQAPPPPPSHEALRDDARLVLERHCGECHIGWLPSALPEALAVYDLTEPDWAHRMSDAQLEKLGERIREGALFDPFDIRNEGKEPPPAPTESEQEAVRRYVRAEVARRGR